MYIVIKEALNKNPVDPISRESGKINNPSKIPRFFKIFSMAIYIEFIFDFRFFVK